MHIKDLNDDQKQRIAQALETDGFSNIKIHPAYISYSKGYRDFDLYTTNIGADYNCDDFLNISFREQEYFDSKKSSENSSHLAKAKSIDFKNYLKVRHTVSLNQRVDGTDDDSAIQSIPGWKLVSSQSFNDLSYFYTQPESTELKHIEINAKDHIALNHGEGNFFLIYEASPEIFLAILKENPENFALTPSFLSTLKEINEENK